MKSSPTCFKRMLALFHQCATPRRLYLFTFFVADGGLMCGCLACKIFFEEVRRFFCSSDLLNHLFPFLYQQGNGLILQALSFILFSQLFLKRGLKFQFPCLAFLSVFSFLISITSFSICHFTFVEILLAAVSYEITPRCSFNLCDALWTTKLLQELEPQQEETWSFSHTKFVEVRGERSQRLRHLHKRRIQGIITQGRRGFITSPHERGYII